MSQVAGERWNQCMGPHKEFKHVQRVNVCSGEWGLGCRYRQRQTLRSPPPLIATATSISRACRWFVSTNRSSLHIISSKNITWSRTTTEQTMNVHSFSAPIQNSCDQKAVMYASSDHYAMWFHLKLMVFSTCTTQSHISHLSKLQLLLLLLHLWIMKGAHNYALDVSVLVSKTQTIKLTVNNGICPMNQTSTR